MYRLIESALFHLQALFLIVVDLRKRPSPNFMSLKNGQKISAPIFSHAPLDKSNT